MVHLDLVNFSIEDITKTLTTHLSNKACKKKKVVKVGTSCGSFRTSQFCHKRHNTNIDHLFIQQNLQEKKVVKSIINCGLSITS